MEANFDIQATLDAVRLLDRCRHEEFPGTFNAVTAVLFSAARKLDEEVREALTGE